jgi:RHS repeat-associated protein
VHGGSVGGGMEVYNGGVESTQSIGGSGWLNKTTERVFEFVADSDMVMLKFFSGEVSGVEANMYLSKVEISIANSNHYSRIRGDKTYELSNHLGNVLATITDRKLGFSNNTSNNITTHYQAEVTSATDYYPFGSPMSKRSVFDYKSKYGFQNQEKEDEITELTGTHYSAEYWMYDSRLGRRWNLDPIDQIEISNYSVLKNSPIVTVDIKGDIPWWKLVEGWDKNNKPNPPTDNRFHPVYKKHRAHHGMDMASETGVNVNSAAKGKVIRVQTYTGYGTTVVVDHGNGFLTLYAHLNSTLVKVGDNVDDGQKLGKVGNTGIGSGPHLHVEYIKFIETKNIYSDSELLKDKSETRYNPMNVDDLQNIIDEKEEAIITFLNGESLKVGSIKNIEKPKEVIKNEKNENKFIRFINYLDNLLEGRTISKGM